MHGEESPVRLGELDDYFTGLPDAYAGRLIDVTSAEVRTRFADLDHDAVGRSSPEIEIDSAEPDLSDS